MLEQLLGLLPLGLVQPAPTRPLDDAGLRTAEVPSDCVAGPSSSAAIALVPKPFAANSRICLTTSGSTIGTSADGGAPTLLSCSNWTFLLSEAGGGQFPCRSGVNYRDAPHRGIAAAVRRLLPKVKQQRCVVHLQRNVLTKAPQRLRTRLANEVSEVFAAASKGEAK